VIRVRVLGEVSVVTGEGDVVTLPRGLPRQLVGFVALHKRPVSRREVVEHLWPDVAEGAGLRRLRTALWEVQRTLDDAAVVDSARTTLALKSHVTVDLDEAEYLLASGANEAALRLLDPGLSVELDQDWAAPARNRAHALLSDALKRLVDESSDPQVALEYSRRRVNLDLLSEPAHQDLVRCLVRTGDRSAAFAAFGRMREVLDRELGAAPSPESRRLLAALAEGNGAHEPASMKPPTRSRGRVPVPPTALVGRERELAEVVDRLSSSRLVTITGIGGMGKSRLAVAVAEAVQDQEPVIFVELAATRQPETCEYVVAAQLGVVAGPGREVADAIAERLEADPGLLVLDNCEHVHAYLTHLVTEVMARCGDSRILATSRERLAIPGEHVVALEPLGLPAEEVSDGTALASDAVHLLLDAAVRRGASTDELGDPAALAGLARRLGGIPLALELAGGRLTTFEPAALSLTLQRGLSVLAAGTTGRHASLAGTFDWSLSTLAPGDRRLLGLMATCPGQLPVDLVEGLARSTGVGLDPAPALVRLVEAGLVRASAQPTWSYAMLEPVRLYAEDRLHPDDRRLAETALLRWTMAFCDRTGALLEDDELAASIAFEHCFPLIRQAVYTARARDDFDTERRIVHAIEPWATWRLLPEAWNWVVHLADDPQGRSADAQTFGRAAVACMRQGQIDGRRDFTEQCVRVDPESYEANYASLQLAWWERRWADVVHFTARLDERSRSGTAIQRGLCAASLVFLGELDAALDMAEQAKAFADRTGMPTVKSLTTEMLGRAYAARRRAGLDAPDPHPFLIEARRLAASVGSGEMEAGICTELARQAFLDERHADAVEPLRFVCEYHLTGSHWNHDDHSKLRSLIEALDRSGRTETADALTALVDSHRLTLRRLREVVADSSR
jgi:predicted ATPase/DNA-binding SARP family transcriptional activator